MGVHGEAIASTSQQSTPLAPAAPVTAHLATPVCASTKSTAAPSEDAPQSDTGSELSSQPFPGSGPKRCLDPVLGSAAGRDLQVQAASLQGAESEAGHRYELSVLAKLTDS